MSMKKDTARRVFGTAMLTAGILLFTACPQEVGLGSAVDTQKPVISISTPEADSVIKGDITLTGTVSDDLSVKSVTVTFTSTSQPSLASKSYQATVDAQAKTWTLTVNTTDAVQGLSDSNYEITATAADSTNKTSSASRSFQIDNTAPTVLITSPSLYGSEANRTKFCSQLEIKGEAYDASRIQTVQVYLCNATGAVAAGPLTADGTNTWSALFAPDDLTALHDGEIYYFYAVATDASGNRNTGFYHKADIYSLPNGSNPFPSINDIGRLDQGGTASSSCKLDSASLKTVYIGTGAEAIKTLKDTVKGYPDFTYQAQADAAILWTNLGDDSASSIIGVNSAVFATIQPPTDNSAIKLDTIEIKIRTKNGSSDGEWISQPSVTRQKVGESVNISVSPKTAEGQALQEGTYEVSLKCNTNSNAEIISNKVFQIQSDAPVVEESLIGSGAAAFAQGIISENSTITGLSGKFLRSNHEVIPLSNLSADSFSIICKNSAGVTVSPEGGWYITSNGSSNDGVIEYVPSTGFWSLPVVAGSRQYPDDTYTFSISGSLGEAETMITRVVVVDTEVPEVNIVSPSAGSCITISESGAGLTLQGSAMDSGSGILATYWCIDDTGAVYNSHTADVAYAAVLGENTVPQAGTWYKFSTPTVFNLIPVMSGYEQKDYKFFCFTKDQAGHVSEVTAVPFFIDNAKPVISVTAWSELTRKNVSNMTISGKAWDSSGALEKIWVSFDGRDALEVEDVSEGIHASEGTAANWMFPGTAVIQENLWTDGTHTLAFTVKDKAGRVSDVVTNTFIIDNVAPSVTVANLTDNAVLSDMAPISGTAIDTLSGLKENGITYSLDGGQTWRTDVDNQSGAWTITLPDNSGEDSQRINIKAEDRAGNTYETGDIHFTIDKDDPRASILVNSETTPSSDTFMTKDGFTLSGTADDAARTTGRQADKAKLTYSKDGGSAVTVFDSETGINTDCWNQAAGKWTWTTGADFAEGFYTFTLTVTDKANKKATATKSVRYDYTAPVLTVTTPAENEPFASQKITMTGNVSDSGIGVDKIYYTLDDGDPTVSSDFILPTGNSWTKEVTFTDEGVHTLKIMASDALGNTTGIKTVHFSRDDAPPSLEELSVSANGKTTNAGFSLAGKTYDTNGVKYITVFDGTTTWSSNISLTGDGTKAGISLTPATSAPSSNNWNIDFEVGSAHAESGTFIADGTTTFTITVTDVAGKTATVSRSVKVDTTKPSIEAPVLQNAVVKLDESAYNKLTVAASDSGTGLAGVYYQVVAPNAAAPSFDSDTGWTALALGSDGWTGTIDFTGKAEGEHKIFVAAKDTAGNRIRYGESASTGPVATSVVVDAKKPVITVTGLTEASNADVELTIVIDDTNPDAEKLTVQVLTPSGASLGNLTKTADGTNTWKVTVPFSNSDDISKPYHTDGLYKIVVNETDTRGRTAEPVTHTIRKDTTAPEINTIDNPDSDKTGSDALYGTSFIFRGKAKDKSDNSACAGVTKILYAFTQSSAVPSDPDSYTTLSVTDGTPWNITMDLAEGHASSAGTLSEGKWYLYVFAEDKSGNRSATPAKREFDVDMKDPVLSITAPADSTKTAYTDTAAFTIGGTATDSNGIATNADGKKYVTVKIGSAAAVQVEVSDDDSWSYTYARTEANKDQLLSATIIATDMAGKSVIKTLPFYFDTQAPVIAISKPADGESIVVDGNNKYTISGTATDLGIGIDPARAKFIITGTDEKDLVVSGASWSTAVDFTGKAEGTLTLKVTVADKLNQSTSLTRNFYYDKADPELRVATVSATGLTTNTGFQLAGTAWDTNGVDCITVSDGTHTWTSAGVSPTVSLSKKTSDPGTAAEDRNWSINFVVGDYTGNEAPVNWISDGTTIFTITVKDIAGKTSTVTRTVTVDTTKPSVSDIVLSGSDEIPADKVYLDEGKFKKITVTAADTGTGLAGVYYQVVAPNADAPSFNSDTGWTALALGSDGWTGNIDFTGKAEGDHKIYVAAKDNAGNRICFNEAKTVIVDAKKPVISANVPESTGAVNVTFSVTITDTNPSNPVITMKNPAGGTIESAGISNVEDNTVPENAGYKKYNITVPFSNAADEAKPYYTDGLYTVVVKETDTRGRTAEKEFVISKDTTAPSVAIDSPAGKTGLNALYGSTFLIRGTANDNEGGSGVAKVLYAFTTTAAAPADTAYTELAASDGTWSFSKGMNTGHTADAGTDNLYEGTWYLHVLAVDKAGNKAAMPVTCMFDIDMKDPELAVTETSVGNDNITNATFTFSGTASDTNALYAGGTGAVKVTAIRNGTTANAVNEAVNVTNGGWTASFTPGTGDGQLADGTYYFTFTVTDAVGRTKAATSTVIVDKGAPEIKQAAGKTSFLTETATPVNAGNVTENWFNREYLNLKAVVTDNTNGSGISTVEYAVSNTETEPASWAAGTISWNTMAGSSAGYTASLQVADGTNFICIRAADKAGNVTYSTAEKIKVDLNAPAISGVYTDAACTQTLVNGTYLTNKKDLTLYFKTSEAGSGIKELKVSLNGQSEAYTADAVYDAAGNYTGKHSLEISGNDLNAWLKTDGTHIISAVISDKAGNSTPVSQLFTIQYDNEAPVVEFKSPDAGATVNKKVTVTGTTTEAQTLESVLLYKGDYSHSEPAAQNKLTEFTGNNRYNWTYTLDTESYVDSSGTMTLTVVATDKAGNVTKTPHTFAVDQATDCPQITINNIAFGADEENGKPAMSEANPKWLIGNKTIYGFVTDDDGLITKLEIKKDNEEWTELTVNNGSFSTIVKTNGKAGDYLEDGGHTILFRVTDKNGTVFTTAAENALTRPVLKDNDDTPASDNKLHVTIDTMPPNTTVTEFSLNATDWDSNLLTNTTFGKVAEHNTFYVRQYVYDTNGIEKVEVSIDSNDYKPASLVTEAGKALKKTINGADYLAYQYQVTTAQIAEAESGVRTLNIRVTDNAGMNKDMSTSFSIDNAAPTIAITSHSDGDRVQGSIFLAGTTSDAPSYTGAASISYMITASETLAADDDWADAHEIIGSNLSTWRLYFDAKDKDAVDYTHDNPLKEILVSIRPYSDYLKIKVDDTGSSTVVYSKNYKDSDNVEHKKDDLYKDITPLYVHFKASDAYGNTSHAVRSLELDPQGDIPSVEITYPGATAYRWRNSESGKQYFTAGLLPEQGNNAYTSLVNVSDGKDPAVIQAINRSARTITVGGVTYTFVGGESVQGGIVRLQGIAEDENAIKQVFIQIDPTYDPAVGFKWNDAAAGSELMPYGTTSAEKRPANMTLGGKYEISDIGTSGKKGISVGTSGTWSISLNDSGEFNGIKLEGDEESVNNYVAIRAIALDADGNISPSTDLLILTIDADTPRIGTSEELYLYQYDNNAEGSGNVIASQKYTDDMWLKGEWWLEGSVEDSNGITTLKIDDADAEEKATPKDWGSDNNKTSGYKLKFMIGNAESGKFGTEKHTISAVDKDNKSAQKIIRINYDNKAPVLAEPGTETYRISSTVVQSNGFYTLGSSVTENSSETASQSGFERVAVYFTRPATKTTPEYLYDTFILKNGDGNKTALSDLSKEDGLYWKAKTVTRNSALLSELTLSAADSNVHAGGLVKLGGAIYRIKSVNDRTVIIEGSPEARYTDAKFALAQIVDHTLTESNGVSLGSNGYYSDVMNDDGDCMVESVTRQGATTVWEANINSRNIPDGAIEIHYVVFDKAGNYAEGVVENAMVANNAPRLAGVLYGTDDNGDGIVKDNELKKDQFAIDKANGNGYIRSSLVSSYVLGTKTVNQDSTVHLDKVALKIKGGIAVVPEIVGGNGDLHYSLSVTKDGEKEPYYVKAAENWTKTDSEGKSVQVMGTDYTAQQNGPASEIISDAAISLSLNDLLRKNDEGKAIADDSDAKRLFTFTIWDSTEGLIPGETSQKAVIEMVSALNLKDKNKPVPTVNPFYWTNETTNSVYKNGKALMGHIDLKADLPDSFTDRHDKVSGKIVIEGTVKDDIQLESLYMKIFTGSSDTETDAFTFKTGDKTTAYTVTIGNKTFYKVASYAAGTWTSESHLNDYGWAFSVGRDTFSQDEGHTATWQLVLDTEKLDKAVVNDLKVAIMAKDLGSPTLSVKNNEEVITWIGNDSELPSDSTSNLTVFDVVPYITELETTINNAQTNNTRLFNRSALGLYPVRRGETVTIKGYNLKAGSTAPVVKLGDKKPTVKESSVSQIKFTVGNDNKTGDLTVTVLDGKTELASTLNNMHDNSVAYNREANGVTNNLLTDARKLYVWSISNVVTDSQVRYPSFAVGSDSSQSLAFVYSSGSQDIIMKKNEDEFSIDKSATQWYDTAVAIDSQGRMYGAAMNGAGGGAKEGNWLTGRVEVDQANGGYGNFGFYAWNTKNVPGKIYQKESGLFGAGEQWLNPDSSEYNVYSRGRKKVCLENASNGTKADSNRVINPKIAVDNSGNAMIAYYDQLSGQVRFRYGSVSGDPAKDEQLTFSGGLGNHGNKNNGSAANYQILAGPGAGTGNTNRAGEYVAVGLVPVGADGAGTAVVAWCDGQNLYYSYNTKPVTVNNAIWATNTVVIDSDLAGWYVDMDVDKAGGIHIAYYASSKGDLRYAYLPAYDKAADKEIVTVDSYSTTGSLISVKASDEKLGEKYIPYISYFVDSFKRTSISNRVAWPVTLADGKFTAGALDEKFTGSWEVMTIPTDQTPTEYTVGVGIKKNDAGVNNPILGYGTTAGIQTAQLQGKN